MRRFLFATVSLIAAFSLSVLLVRMVGGLNSPLIEGMFAVEINHNNQACWREICPGETTLAEAEKLLRSDRIIFDVQDRGWPGYPMLCWSIRSASLGSGCFSDRTKSGQPLKPSDPVPMIMLDAPNMSLGNLLLVYGEPVQASACAINDVTGPKVFGDVAFTGHVGVQTVPRLNDGSLPSQLDRIPDDTLVRLAPDAFAFQIWIGTSEFAEGGSWKGFTFASCPKG